MENYKKGKIEKCLMQINETIEKGKAMNLKSKADFHSPVYSAKNNKPQFLRVVFSRRSNEIIFQDFRNEKSE